MRWLNFKSCSTKNASRANLCSTLVQHELNWGSCCQRYSMSFSVHPDASLAGGLECLFSTQRPILLEAGSSVCSLVFLKGTDCWRLSQKCLFKPKSNYMGCSISNHFRLGFLPWTPNHEFPCKYCTMMRRPPHVESSRFKICNSEAHLCNQITGQELWRNMKSSHPC